MNTLIKAPRMPIPVQILELTRDTDRSISRRSLRRVWIEALESDFLLAIKGLFYIRDIKGGRGEKRIFNLALQCNWGPELEAKKTKLLNSPSFWKSIAYYGSWKTVLEIAFPLIEESLKEGINNPIDNKSFNPFIVLELFKITIEEDRKRPSNKKLSTLAKWLPTRHTSMARI